MVSTSPYFPVLEDLQVYLYPNKYKDYVCVRDQVSQWNLLNVITETVKSS